MLHRLKQYSDVSMSVRVAATDNYSVTPLVLIAAPTAVTLPPQRIRVRLISIGITTTDASSITVQSLTTNIPLAVLGTPAVGPYVWDFGADGFALPAGEGLELVNSAAGLAFSLAVEAYVNV